jgi:peptidoglycan hydrolase-like protein with peptidoglycan-binding domain
MGATSANIPAKAAANAAANPADFVMSSVASVPQAMTDAYKRIFAWKFSLAGIPATGTVIANGKSLQRITGHRDVYPTARPGQYLYAKIPEIRAGAAALMSAPTRPPAPAPPVVTPPVGSWAVTRYTAYKGVTLQQGSMGSAVVVLQRGLKVAVDGDFGPGTRAALVAFERQQHLALNGVANPLVWDRLEKRDYPLIAYRGLTLRQGSSGAVVVVLQRALRVGADGAFGPKTVAAVSRRSSEAPRWRRPVWSAAGPGPRSKTGCRINGGARPAPSAPGGPVVPDPTTDFSAGALGLFVYGPPKRAQSRDERLNCRGQHCELGKAERLADLVFHVQVLHVDSSLADVAQQPTQRTRLIRDDDDDRGVRRRGRAMLARDEGVPGVAISDGPGQNRPGAHTAPVGVRLQVTQGHEHRIKFFGE